MGIINHCGLSGTAVAARIAKKTVHSRQNLIVSPTYLKAKKLAEDLSFFSEKRIFVMPIDEHEADRYEVKNRDIVLEQSKI
ncbi:MAG: hypothetical protein ACRCUS_07500, partial [Anaerovoracaceae bacterium]